MIIPNNVQLALNMLSQTGGNIKSDYIDNLIDWAEKSVDNANYVISYCTNLISTVRKRTFIDDIYFIRGLMYEVLENYRSAISDFSVAVNTFSDANGALFERGKVYYIIGDLKQALNDLNLVIARAPRENGDYYYYRGLVYRAMGNEINAQSDLQRALKMAK